MGSVDFSPRTRAVAMLALPSQLAPYRERQRAGPRTDYRACDLKPEVRSLTLAMQSDAPSTGTPGVGIARPGIRRPAGARAGRRSGSARLDRGAPAPPGTRQTPGT